MGDEGGEGLRLIASHLAKVKLEFAEREYAAKVRINNLECELQDTLARLEEATQDVSNYQVQVKQLQGQNTYKALVQEREKWKSLIDTLRKDNRVLRTQLAQTQSHTGQPIETGDSQAPALAADAPRGPKTETDPRDQEESKTGITNGVLTPSSSSTSLVAGETAPPQEPFSTKASVAGGTAATAGAANAPATAASTEEALAAGENAAATSSARGPAPAPAPTSAPEGHEQAAIDASGSGAGLDLLQHGRRRQDSLTDPSAELVQLRSEVSFLKHELEDKNVEISALRAKLDRELELKWERDHSPAHDDGGASSGWKRSLLESVVEVLAPYPNITNQDQAFEEYPHMDQENTAAHAGRSKRIPSSHDDDDDDDAYSARQHHEDDIVESASF